MKKRTNCPIAFGLNMIGDAWSLLVLRDVIILGKQNFQDFEASDEGISTNILTNRLNNLEKKGLLTKKRDPENKRKIIYKPTEKALDLLPMILEMVLWSAKYDPNTGAPPHIIKKIKNDRRKQILEIRKRFK